MPAVLISDAAARHYWPNGSAIGKRIESMLFRGLGGSWKPAEIVGVVADVRSPQLVADCSRRISSKLDRWNRPSTLGPSHCSGAPRLSQALLRGFVRRASIPRSPYGLTNGIQDVEVGIVPDSEFPSFYAPLQDRP